jgi:TonB-linked SusC/RagA family outer membrane protein
LKSFLVAVSFLLITLGAHAQDLVVTGTVKDGSGAPVSGVVISSVGTSVSTISDALGAFTIRTPRDGSLSTSFLGFMNQTVPVEGRTQIDIVLVESAEQIDDVIVVGYGVARRATLTGSVVNIAGEEIVKSPAANISTSLAGKLPGLIVNQRSGQPGSDDPDIYIRGSASFNTGNGNAANRPLIIIDGVERDHMGRLNPEDIESFSVLKDASAAIYGARAANGVILITTKRGTAGKATFSFTHNTSFARPTFIPDMLSSAEFAQTTNEAFWERARRPTASPSTPSDTFTPYYSPEMIQRYADGSDPILYPNTDWAGTIMKPYAMQSRTSIQATGGSESVRYLFSYAFQHQGSAFHGNPSNYDQHNARVSVTADLNRYLTLGANINAIVGDQTTPSVTNVIDVFNNVLNVDPTLVARYPNGLIAPGRLRQNPLLFADRGFEKTSNVPIFSTFTATLKIPWVEGMKVEASFNYDIRNQFRKRWDKPYFYHEYNTVTQEYERRQGGPTTIDLRDTYNKWTTMMYNVRLTYDRTFAEKHNVSAMVGMEQQKNKSSNANAYRKNFLSSLLPEIGVGSTAAEDKDNGGSSNMSARDTYFGRFNYNYSQKYLAELIFRYDGSANFMKGKRYGFFPAVSVGWRISEEPFMARAHDVLEQLKLRASIGQVGSDRVPAFQFLQSYYFENNYVFGTTVTPSVFAGTPPNPDVTWEVSTKYDFGVDVSLWRGLLGFEFTYFREDRSNILATRGLQVSEVVGYTGQNGRDNLPDENIGKAMNQGFEIIINHRNRVNQDFSYDISANMSYAKNKVVYMAETPNTKEWRDQTGRPIGASLYYKADGIYHTQAEIDAYLTPGGQNYNNVRPGDIKVVDLDGNGVINSDDQYRFGFTATPRAVFGLTANFQYKSLDLTLAFQGQSGAYNYDSDFTILGNPARDNSYKARARDRWTVDNPYGTMPRAEAWQPGNTTFFLYDATFIRLKNAELGYSFPERWVSKVGLTNLRFYVSGFNLLTWAKEIKWSDPELSGRSLYYGQQRVFNLGVNVKF